MNTNNGVNWRKFIVPKKVEQINDYLFIDTYSAITYILENVFYFLYFVFLPRVSRKKMCFAIDTRCDYCLLYNVYTSFVNVPISRNLINAHWKSHSS